MKERNLKSSKRDTARPFDLEAITRENIRQLRPYASARDEFKGDAAGAVFLDANEQPAPLQGLPAGVNRYPKYSQDRVKERLAAIKGVRPGQVFLGNGSDEAIDLLMRCFARPGMDRIMVFPPTFGMYEVCARINDLGVVRVPLDADFRIVAGRLEDSLDDSCRLVFFCNPNNPTGNTQDKEVFLKTARDFKGLVVVDEAYVDFCPEESLVAELDRHPNLVVLQTFSKAWGLAGARVGVAYASPDIIATLSKAKAPYNVGGPACGLAEEALNRFAEYRIGVAQTVQERKNLVPALEGLPGVEKVYPSRANFLLVKTTGADALYGHLAEKGVVVRNRTREPGCEGCLRVTVGSPAENRRLLEAWSSFGRGVEEAPPVGEGREASPSTGPGMKTLRQATVSRRTAETDISLRLVLDGTGHAGIHTGIGFLDHMLQQVARHGLLDLYVEVRGDLQVDAHHSVEDTAIVLGQAFREALGDKTGIERYGFAVPMDESRAAVMVDFGGRTFLRWDVRFVTSRTGELPTSLYEHFFRSFAEAAACNLHVKARGTDDHHRIEAIFKAFARALRMAVTQNTSGSLPSTKGLL
jgi:histidinol-phosphate aminotransferase